jgi:hypothetical protein
MRFFFISFILLSTAAFSQNKLIELKIDSLITDDSNPKERKFTVNYHIKNGTAKPITFVLRTKSIVSIVKGSGSTALYYKLFEENSPIDVSGILRTRVEKNSAIDSLLGAGAEKGTFGKNIQKYLEKLKYSREKEHLNSIVKISPNEIKYYSISLYWNKERYQKEDDIEYYWDEKLKHYFEISANLMKEQLENKFSPEQFENIIADKTLVVGWFTSNKVEIDL